ncbi:MAG: FG-GAP repeat protein [Candidatus Pacearchaeota archaeon]|jgi:hypothetical protein
MNIKKTLLSGITAGMLVLSSCDSYTNYQQAEKLESGKTSVKTPEYTFKDFGKVGDFDNGSEYDISTGDFDGDGKTDIAVITANGTLYIIKNKMPENL